MSAGASPPRPWPGPRPGPSQSGPTVEIADEQTAVALDAAHLGDLAHAVLVDHGVQRGELSLSFVDVETISQLNQRYLDGVGATDVLAFPLDDHAADVTQAAGSGGPDPVPVLLGDVAVCPEVAARNAAARSVSTDDELALLVVHGVLHVLGMDHAEPDEAAAMQACERRLLERLRA